MTYLLKTNLTIDPFTGLPNLFGLLESGDSLIQGHSGSIIAADIAHLTNINRNYGRNAGDSCVRALAGVLRSEIEKQTHLITPSAFRMGGDEFLLFLPSKNPYEANILALEIKNRFRNLIHQDGVLGASLHTTIIPFEKTDISIASLLKSSYLALANSRKSTKNLAPLPSWADGLIDTMIDRVRETLELLHQTRTLALTDEISGLANHRAADIILTDLLNEYHQNNHPCSILFIDGDNLKQYNNLGYQRGNQMIRDLANVISDSIRHGDRVTRWLSGDEFVVLLPKTERSIALQIGERIRFSVEKVAQSWEIPITVSVGIAQCPVDGVNIEELIAKAEAANLTSKQSGKNKVC